MKLKQIRIENFRSIDKLEFTTFNFTSLIGQNNCGKSSILRAIAIFLNQEKPTVDDWRQGNESQPIIISGTFEDIVDWERDTPGVAGIIQNNQIQLRVVHERGGAKGTYEAYIQQEDIEGWDLSWKLLSEELKQLATDIGINGTGWKSGANRERLKQYLRDSHPEMIAATDAVWTSESISISAALRQALPQAQIIPAVRDASDETKPQKQTTFGKLLNAVVLPAIQRTSEYEELKHAVDNLSKKVRGHEDVEQPSEVQQLADDISTRLASIIDIKAILDIAEPIVSKK